MQIVVKMKQFGDHYDTQVYQTTHNVGGAIMGEGVFPQNIGYNPLGLVGALAYWSAKAIRTTYLKGPGPLVQA